MNKVKINLEITFSDNILEKEHRIDICENVSRALLNETNSWGLSPDNFDGYTTKIIVESKECMFEVDVLSNKINSI